MSTRRLDLYPPVYLAPGASTSPRAECPSAATATTKADWPAPDEHVVEPETYREMIDGQVLELTPAEPPHADQQCDIAYVLRAHVADGYVGSTELLTRVSEHNDFATDACIRKQGTDESGHRYLEELSFEIKHKQSQASLDKRARYLSERGVRRVFAIYVRAPNRNAPAGSGQVIAGPVKEWSRQDNQWLELAADGRIEDPCLHRPVQVSALLQAVEADNAVVRALLDKGNPVLLQLKADSYDRGTTDGYDQGKADGYDQGKADGHDQGYNQGKADGYDQGKTDGHDQGYSQGKTDGYDQGKADGHDQGYNQGKADGLRQAIRTLCQAFAIQLTPERNAQLTTLAADELQAVLEQIRTHRSWNSP